MFRRYVFLAQSIYSRYANQFRTGYTTVTIGHLDACNIARGRTSNRCGI